MQAASGTTAATVTSIWANPQVVAALLQATGTILGALIVGSAGSWLTKRFARERDRQDRESQWRMHAVELTKLDIQRKLACRNDGDPRPRPAVLDFLANYRDLQELGGRTPKDLYQTILSSRIATGEVTNEHAPSGEKLLPGVVPVESLPKPSEVPPSAV